MSEIPQDIREKARRSALTAVGMVCRNVADQEDWSVEVDYVTAIIARAILAHERETIELCAKTAYYASVDDVASSICATAIRETAR